MTKFVKLTKAERPKHLPFRTDKPVYRYGRFFVGPVGYAGWKRQDWFAFTLAGERVSFADSRERLVAQLKEAAA